MGGALAILVVTLATTFYAWHLVRVSVVEQDTERFKDEVRRMIELLRANHRRHLDTLNPIGARRARLTTLGAKKLAPRNTRKAGEKERTREAGERDDHESVHGNFLQPQLRNRRARIRRRPARGAACARSIRSFSNRGSV